MEVNYRLIIKEKAMKTLFSFAFIMFMSVMTFAQELATATKQELSSIKTEGKGSIVMPSTLTSDDVAKASSYYTRYFTVEFDENTHKATIIMNDNSEKSRIVIVRFLSACGVDSVNIDGESVDKMVVFERYWK